MSDVKALDDQLNQMILSGKMLDAFEQFYADDVVMQENSDEPRKGKDTNRKFEEEFLAKVDEFHGASLAASAAGEEVSFSEWEWDITFKGSHRVKMSQVSVRRWKDGKVAHERFYYKPAM